MVVVAVIGIVIGIFALVYAFAWIFPRKARSDAFFQPRPEEHKPLVFAHQGAEGIRPSNTMLGFRHAHELGSDVLDADIHMTKDGVLVLIHDETVDRTTNGTGAVRDLTYDQIRQLDAGYRFTTDNGETFPYRGKGLYVPTVDEFLQEFKGTTRFGLEIKQVTAEAVEKLCQTIHTHNIEKDVLASSFLQTNMDIFRTHCPEVASSAAPEEGKTYYLLYRFKLSGLYRPKFDALQIPEYNDGTLILTSDLIKVNQRKNIQIVPWTINEEADLKRIMALGVDGINTNHPDRLIALIEK